MRNDVIGVGPAADEGTETEADSGVVVADAISLLCERVCGRTAGEG
jgi:hypothetical protein